MPERQPINPLRIQLALGIMAIIALVLGFWQIRTLIYLPFAPDSENSQEGDENLENSDLFGVVNTPSDEELQTKDTDSDGLTDYDEINIYKTSAYLKDTDSDSYDDKAEVISGKDPNCATDSGCAKERAKTDSTLPTPAQIREVLKQKGADPALLAKYDDATLIKLYRELNTEQVTASQENTVSPTNTSPATPPQLSAEDKQRLLNMSGAELKKFLIDNGADPTILGKFDDTTLKALIKQTLGL